MLFRILKKRNLEKLFGKWCEVVVRHKVVELYYKKSVLFKEGEYIKAKMAKKGYKLVQEDLESGYVVALIFTK